jgi:hypothetical protein
VRGTPRVVPPPPPASTNPTSTKCTAPSPCPSAPAARHRENPRPTTPRPAAAAKSSSPPTRANPAPNSARPPAPPAVRRGIGAGGRSASPLGARAKADYAYAVLRPVRKADISHFRRNRPLSRPLSPTRAPLSRPQFYQDVPYTAVSIALQFSKLVVDLSLSNALAENGPLRLS